MYFKKLEPIKHVVILGKQGTGKDLLANKFVWDEYNKGKTIYANQELYNINYKKIESVNDIDNAFNGILYLHDIDLIFNSRDFMLGNKNTEAGLLEIVNNLRKQKLELIATCHRPKSIDVKVRTLINYWIIPELILEGKDENNFYDYIIKYKIYDEYQDYIGMHFIGNLPFYCKNYDTNARVKQLIRV
jgi:hypothetical protein